MGAAATGTGVADDGRPVLPPPLPLPACRGAAREQVIRRPLRQAQGRQENRRERLSSGPLCPLLAPSNRQIPACRDAAREPFDRLRASQESSRQSSSRQRRSNDNDTWHGLRITFRLRPTATPRQVGDDHVPAVAAVEPHGDVDDDGVAVATDAEAVAASVVLGVERRPKLPDDLLDSRVERRRISWARPAQGVQRAIQRPAV